MYLSFEKGVALHLITLVSDALRQVWLKLAKWFLRKRKQM